MRTFLVILCVYLFFVAFGASTPLQESAIFFAATSPIATASSVFSIMHSLARDASLESLRTLHGLTVERRERLAPLR